MLHCVLGTWCVVQKCKNDRKYCELVWRGRLKWGQGTTYCIGVQIPPRSNGAFCQITLDTCNFMTVTCIHKTIYHREPSPLNIIVLDRQTLCSWADIFREFLQSGCWMVTASWIARSSRWHSRCQVSTVAQQSAGNLCIKSTTLRRCMWLLLQRHTLHNWINDHNKINKHWRWSEFFKNLNNHALQWNTAA